VEVSKTPPSKNGSTTTVTSYPPLPHLFGFTEKIPMPKGTGPAGGSKIIGEKKARHPGDYSETTVASWSLTPRDPCDDVRKLIEQDLAWTEAYMDEAIRQQAKGDPQAMKKLVYKRVYKAGGVEGGGSGDADIEMKLDGKCEIVGADEFKKKALEDCKPGIIVDTLLAHENRHVGQCKFAEENRAGEPGGRHSYFNPTPEEYGNNEGAAHLVGIRKALNWYEDNCKGDTSSMRARKAAMESKLGKRP
jgi:hypothetical protein